MKKTSTLFILATIAGAFAGIIATVLTNQSLDEYAQRISQDQILFQLAQERPRPLPGTYEEGLARVQEAGWSAVALLQERTDDSLIPSEWITESDSPSAGVVVTNDGWVLFHESAVEPYISDITQMEVWIEGNRYLVEDLFEDEHTGFVLVRVDGSTLPVLGFGASREMMGGDLLFGVSRSGEIIPTSVTESRMQTEEIVHEAEQFGYIWETPSLEQQHMPLLNSNGELVGFTQEGSLATPVHQIQPFVESVLKDRRVIHTGIGMYTVSLHEVLNINKEAIGAEVGELIAKPTATTDAVVAQGPADLAGLEEGDVILAVDDVFIDDRITLADLVAEYEPEDSIELLALREGERQVFTVVLGELLNLY